MYDLKDCITIKGNFEHKFTKNIFRQLDLLVSAFILVVCFFATLSFFFPRLGLLKLFLTFFTIYIIKPLKGKLNIF